MIKVKGFTLIEIMIVVVIIAILAAIAYPSYQQYKIRASRADAQSEMSQIAQQLQNYKVVNNQFAQIKADGTLQAVTVTDVYGGTQTPRQGTALYTLSLALTNNNQSWILTATPIAGKSQAGNGVICLNDQGWKYWVKAATTCALTATSTWDGR